MRARNGWDFGQNVMDTKTAQAKLIKKESIDEKARLRAIKKAVEAEQDKPLKSPLHHRPDYETMQSLYAVHVNAKALAEENERATNLKKYTPEWKVQGLEKEPNNFGQNDKEIDR